MGKACMSSCHCVSKLQLQLVYNTPWKSQKNTNYSVNILSCLHTRYKPTITKPIYADKSSSKCSYNKNINIVIEGKWRQRHYCCSLFQRCSLWLPAYCQNPLNSHLNSSDRLVQHDRQLDKLIFNTFAVLGSFCFVQVANRWVEYSWGEQAAQRNNSSKTAKLSTDWSTLWCCLSRKIVNILQQQQQPAAATTSTIWQTIDNDVVI